MIAVDTQIMIYAHRGEMAFHEEAARALAGLAESGSAWTIPWPCVHEFVGTVTKAQRFRPVSTTEDALQFVRWLQASGTLRLIGETSDHLDRLGALLKAGKVTGAAVHDARIAAICLSHGVRELWTADRDFSRFPALRVRNPLVG